MQSKLLLSILSFDNLNPDLQRIDERAPIYHINENTKLNDMYETGMYQPIALEYYVDKICKIISNLNKDIIVHRITGDPNLKILVEPKWTGRKKIVLNSINNRLNDLDVVQGDKKLKFINL